MSYTELNYKHWGFEEKHQKHIENFLGHVKFKYRRRYETQEELSKWMSRSQSYTSGVTVLENLFDYAAPSQQMYLCGLPRLEFDQHRKTILNSLFCKTGEGLKRPAEDMFEVHMALVSRLVRYAASRTSKMWIFPYLDLLYKFAQSKECEKDRVRRQLFVQLYCVVIGYCEIDLGFRQDTEFSRRFVKEVFPRVLEFAVDQTLYTTAGKLILMWVLEKISITNNVLEEFNEKFEFSKDIMDDKWVLVRAYYASVVRIIFENQNTARLNTHLNNNNELIEQIFDNLIVLVKNEPSPGVYKVYHDLYKNLQTR